jgi:hypothetical protein
MDTKAQTLIARSCELCARSELLRHKIALTASITEDLAKQSAELVANNGAFVNDAASTTRRCIELTLARFGG